MVLVSEELQYERMEDERMEEVSMRTLATSPVITRRLDRPFCLAFSKHDRTVLQGTAWHQTALHGTALSCTAWY